MFGGQVMGEARHHVDMPRNRDAIMTRAVPIGTYRHGLNDQHGISREELSLDLRILTIDTLIEYGTYQMALVTNWIVVSSTCCICKLILRSGFIPLIMLPV